MAEKDEDRFNQMDKKQQRGHDLVNRRGQADNKGTTGNPRTQ